jgi:hypothetical protein
MRLSVFAVAIVATALIGTRAQAQTSTDFTGKWTLVVDKSEPGGISAFGDSFTATQTVEALSIARILKPWGGRQGASPPSPVTYVYKFDGTETNHQASSVNNRMMSQSFNTTSWSGSRLSILTVYWRDAPMRQLMWLEPDGTLVVETTKAEKTNRNSYKKTL